MVGSYCKLANIFPAKTLKQSVHQSFTLSAKRCIMVLHHCFTQHVFGDIILMQLDILSHYELLILVKSHVIKLIFVFHADMINLIMPANMHTYAYVYTYIHTYIHTYISVGWYHIFTSGIQYYKLRTVFSIPRYLIKQVDEPLSSVNG